MMAEVEESHEIDNVEELEASEKPVYSLEVLAVIKESQQQHGLRHGDYQRYRSYCSRRLRRIRKSVNLVNGVKNRYVPKSVKPQQVKDVRCLYIPLVQAERCWSYAMQLKAESSEDHRKRFRMLNKLRKAEHYAQELVTLCEQVCIDPRTKLEVQAYREWIAGILHFELMQWQQSIELLSKAKMIYEKLSGALSGDAAAVYQQKVTDIEPSIRYCAYNIGDVRAAADLKEIRLAMGHTDSELDELIQKTQEKQAGSLHEVTWRQRVIPIKNDKVRVFLLSERESEEEVKSAADLDTKIEVYDRVIKDCIDTLVAVKDDLKGDEVFRKIQRGLQFDGRVPVQVFLHTYLQYIKINKTIKRNLLMVDLYKKSVGKPSTEGQKFIRPQDIARLYEIITLNFADIPNLPGLKDDSELEEEVQTEILAHRAFRCYWLAVAYSQNKQWPEVVALCKKSQEYTSQARPKLSGTNALLLNRLVGLGKDTDALLIEAQASSILDSSAQELARDLSKLSITADKRPIAERLDEYLPEDPKISSKKVTLIKSPPDMQPLPCKPLFFDLAFNHVQLPDVSHKLAKDEKKAGITGFMKSWAWGWGSKK